MKTHGTRRIRRAAGSRRGPSVQPGRAGRGPDVLGVTRVRRRRPARVGGRARLRRLLLGLSAQGTRLRALLLRRPTCAGRAGLRIALGLRCSGGARRGRAWDRGHRRWRRRRSGRGWRRRPGLDWWRWRRRGLGRGHCLGRLRRGLGRGLDRGRGPRLRLLLPPRCASLHACHEDRGTAELPEQLAVRVLESEREGRHVARAVKLRAADPARFLTDGEVTGERVNGVASRRDASSSAGENAPREPDFPVGTPLIRTLDHLSLIFAGATKASGCSTPRTRPSRGPMGQRSASRVMAMRETPGAPVTAT
jgi:hypothetical protein